MAVAAEVNQKRGDRIDLIVGEHGCVEDILTDIMHYCKSNDLSFEDVLRTAEMHFDAESEINGAFIYFDEIDSGESKAMPCGCEIRYVPPGVVYSPCEKHISVLAGGHVTKRENEFFLYLEHGCEESEGSLPCGCVLKYVATGVGFFPCEKHKKEGF